jgi:hypothetical protein
MRGHSLIYVVVLLGVLAASLPLFVVPVSGHRLSELFRSRTPAAAELTAARKSPRFSARYAKHVHRGRESAHALQSSLWEETKAQAIQDGQFRKKEFVGKASNSRVFYVTDNNADPTGYYDSTRALQATINQAFNVPTHRELLPGIPDLGGVEIHLEGGDYLISSPLQFPSKGGGNLVIHGGSIRASDRFPKDGYLIELWTAYSQSLRANKTKASLRDRTGHTLTASNEYLAFEKITIRDLLLDANFRGGGILVVDSIRVMVENVYVTHFYTDGILVEGGHETYIHDSFFGQYITSGGDPRESSFSGIGINLISNDNLVSDVVIFSAAYGISISGQANLITGVHAYNKATAFGGVGIYLQLPGYTQTRILGCYLDFTGIIAEDPLELEIADSFFLGDGNILLRSTKKSHSIYFLTITGNMFAGSSKGTPTVELDESAGRFTSVYDTVIDQNTAYGMVLKSTVARATLSRTNSWTWKLDLSERLLFRDFIQNAQYSMYVPGKDFPRHVLRSVKDNTVIVDTDARVTGTVSVLVDQSSDSLSLSNSGHRAYFSTPDSIMEVA